MPKYSEYPDMPPEVAGMIDWLLNAEHGDEQERCKQIASELFTSENRRTSGIHVVQSTSARIAALERDLAAAQPVAWLYHNTQTDGYIMLRDRVCPVDACYVESPLYATPDPRISVLEAALKIAQDTIEHAERWATHRNDQRFFQSAKERIAAALKGGA